MRVNLSVRIRTIILLGFIALRCSSPEDTTSYAGDFGVLTLDSTRLSIEVLYDSLDVPWDLAWGPDHQLWFTQQKGSINRLDLTSGKVKNLLQLDDVHYQKSRGLFGMVFHPDFDKHPLLYFHYNYLLIQDEDTLIRSRLVRYRLESDTDTLVYDQTLIDNIPGTTYHNGSRLIVTPDHKLILTTGDAGQPKMSQNREVLSGKILRINLDGSIPEDNPDPGSFVYAIGSRNAQGLTYGKDHILYASEHGPNNDDEINILEKGHNYGWPDVEGYCNTAYEMSICEEKDITEPIKAWTPTIAPAGIAYYHDPKIPEWQNVLILVTLKGKSLRVLHLDEAGRKIIKEKIYLQNILGRIRDVCVSPAGDIYLSTSNGDWHPKAQPWMYDSFPTSTDDRIIKLSRITLGQVKDTARIFTEDTVSLQLNSVDGIIVSDQDGTSLYQQHCSSCHLPNGTGIPNLIPPLESTEWVSGNKNNLIKLVLNGLSDKIVVKDKTYQQEMPGFKTSLNDAEIASVLTYIRQHFNNNSSAISAQDVHELRIEL